MIHILNTVGNRTVGLMMAEHAHRHPDREFLVFESTTQQVETFTWKQVDEIVIGIIHCSPGRGS